MSKRPYGRAHGKREWRKGKFQVIGFPLPSEESSIFPRALWGTEFLSLSGLEDHLACTLDRAPEGFTVVARCHACGGRQEGLLDMREILKEDLELEVLAQKLSDGTLDAADRINDTVQFVLHSILNIWAPEHAACKETPKQYVLPAQVRDFIERVEMVARRLISEGEPAAGHLHILFSDGSAAAFPVHDIPPSSRHSRIRTNEIAARHFSIREMVRVRKLDVLGAVLVSEAWMTEVRAGEEDQGFYPSEQKDKRECLILSAVTPDFGVVGMGEIQRKSGIVDQGPGTVPKISLEPLYGPAGLLDGMFAMTDALSWEGAGSPDAAGVLLEEIEVSFHA